jgi:hypothetical protein
MRCFVPYHLFVASDPTIHIASNCLVHSLLEGGIGVSWISIAVISKRREEEGRQMSHDSWMTDQSSWAESSEREREDVLVIVVHEFEIEVACGISHD